MYFYVSVCIDVLYMKCSVYARDVHFIDFGVENGSSDKQTHELLEQKSPETRAGVVSENHRNGLPMASSVTHHLPGRRIAVLAQHVPVPKRPQANTFPSTFDPAFLPVSGDSISCQSRDALRWSAFEHSPVCEKWKRNKNFDGLR